MSKVAACKGATDAVGACGSSGSWGHKWQSERLSARCELVLLLLEQVVVPVVLLPLRVHVEHRRRAMMRAGSGQFEQES